MHTFAHAPRRACGCRLVAINVLLELVIASAAVATGFSAYLASLIKSLDEAAHPQLSSWDGSLLLHSPGANGSTLTLDLVAAGAVLLVAALLVAGVRQAEWLASACTGLCLLTIAMSIVVGACVCLGRRLQRLMHVDALARLLRPRAQAITDIKSAACHMCQALSTCMHPTSLPLRRLGPPACFAARRLSSSHTWCAGCLWFVASHAWALVFAALVPSARPRPTGAASACMHVPLSRASTAAAAARCLPWRRLLSGL